MRGGSRPGRGKVWRSSSVKAVPLLSAGWSSRSYPERVVRITSVSADGPVAAGTGVFSHETDNLLRGAESSILTPRPQVFGDRQHAANPTSMSDLASYANVI